MENLRNKNVITSVLVGFLIIFGAFYSSSKNDATNSQTLYDNKGDTKKVVLENDTTDNLSLDEIAADLYKSLKPHKLKDLKILKDTSRASQRAYGVELAKILGKYSGKDNPNPVALANSMYETKNYSDISKILDLEKIYLNEVVDLLAIRVPEDIAVTHLNLVNNIDRMGQLLDNMAKVDRDEFLAIGSAKQFALETNIEIALMREVNSYYTDRNISFGSTEKANVYTNVIQ